MMSEGARKIPQNVRGLADRMLRRGMLAHSLCQEAAKVIGILVFVLVQTEQMTKAHCKLLLVSGSGSGLEYEQRMHLSADQDNAALQ